MIEMKIINMNYIYSMWMSQKKKKAIIFKAQVEKGFFQVK